MAAIELCRLGDLNETRRGVNGRKLVNVSTFVYRSQRITLQTASNALLCHALLIEANLCPQCISFLSVHMEFLRNFFFCFRFRNLFKCLAYKNHHGNWHMAIIWLLPWLIMLPTYIDLEPGGKIHVVVELQYTASGLPMEQVPFTGSVIISIVGERGFSLKTLDQRNQHRSEETGGQCWDQAGPCPARLGNKEDHTLFSPVPIIGTAFLFLNQIQLGLLQNAQERMFFNFMQPPPPPPPPSPPLTNGVSSSTNQHPRGRGYERRKIISNCLSIQIDSAKCPLFREISDCQEVRRRHSPSPSYESAIDESMPCTAEISPDRHM
ncbi:hypothetical protein GQR58_025488 [Nymphon striatum]|nr:hypothetical protein GQR58_025488 [Nymphon striatum]